MLKKVIFGAIAANILLVATSQAATINVDTSQDGVVFDNKCSLREAVIAANFNSPWAGCVSGDSLPVIDEIKIPAGIHPYMTASSAYESIAAGSGDETVNDLDIREAVIISGDSESPSAIMMADDTGRVFEVQPYTYLEVKNLKLVNGEPQSFSAGGAVLVHEGSLVKLTDCQVVYNEAEVGGFAAILHGGNLLLQGSTVANSTNNTSTLGGPLVYFFP